MPGSRKIIETQTSAASNKAMPSEMNVVLMRMAPQQDN
jgi:hypothetical protein